MSIDGFDFTKCLDVKGGGNTEQRCMEFTIPGKSEIILYSNAGDKGRTVNIHDGKEVVHSQSANKIVYTATETATLYVYSAGSGIQFFLLINQIAGQFGNGAGMAGFKLRLLNQKDFQTFFIEPDQHTIH